MTRSVPRYRSTDQRYYGVFEALVAENEDPDQEGRVKLRFPWFDGGQEVSDWCRVAQLYAGNGFGSHFIPEKDDEVLVAFMHGDMRFPRVLGGLYNGMDKAPSKRTAASDEKLIRTKGGHELLLDDSSGGEAIRLRTRGGHEVLLDDASRKIEIKGSGVSVTLEDSGTVTVTAATVKVTAGTVELGAGAVEQPILGNAFMALFNVHTHTLVPPLAIPTTPPITPMLPALLSKIVKIAP
jgi:uncharacterized protein involved in type VI secretion and phage assembly